MLAVGFVLAVGCRICLRGRQADAVGGVRRHSIAYPSRSPSSTSILAIGLAAFASSRVVVGVLIAWNAIVSHLLLAIDALGGARKLIDVAAAEHFSPAINDNNQIAMSGTTALLVLIGWAAVAMRRRALVDPAHRRVT